MTQMKLSFKDQMKVTMERNRPLELQKLKLKGRYKFQHLRSGLLIGEYNIDNDITNEGKNLILDTMFNTATQIANNSWFMGLITLAGYSALAPSDVMASHAGWAEFTFYTESVRQSLLTAAASGQAIATTSALTFTISGSGTLVGGFVCSNSTKTGTSGKLWGTGLFSSNVPVLAADVMKATYTLSC